jgi:hypothetical protein
MLLRKRVLERVQSKRYLQVNYLLHGPSKRQICVRDASLSCESLSGEEHSCSNAGNEGEEDPGNDGDRFLEVDE